MRRGGTETNAASGEDSHLDLAIAYDDGPAD
jgi:hypothetical protein